MNKKSRLLIILLLISATPGMSFGQVKKTEPKVPEYLVKISVDQNRKSVVDEKIDSFKTKIESGLQFRPKLAVKVVENLKDSPAVLEIIADSQFRYIDVMALAERAQQAGFESIRIQAIQGLQWESFDRKRYDKFRFAKPTVLTVMADLCPGCRNLRDRFWSDKEILNELAKRKAALFFGVGSEDPRLKEFVKTEYDRDLPVLIIFNSKMGDKPIILPKIPSKQDVLDSLEKKLPSKN